MNGTNIEDEVIQVAKKCCVVFQEELRHVLGVRNNLPDDWMTNNMTRETGRLKIEFLKTKDWKGSRFLLMYL